MSVTEGIREAAMEFACKVADEADPFQMMVNDFILSRLEVAAQNAKEAS